MFIPVVTILTLLFPFLPAPAAPAALAAPEAHGGIPDGLRPQTAVYAPLGAPSVSRAVSRPAKIVPRHVPVYASRYERRVPPSRYHGRYFVRKWEDNRRCIVWRESNNHLRARNSTSSAAGLYQFIQSTANYVARLIHKPYLVGTSAATWPRKIQDRAFWRLFDHHRGGHHWRGGSYSCGV